jgi:predicted GNAT family N-acyltransferase
MGRRLAVREVAFDQVRPLRRRVFIEEQGISAEEEWDAIDQTATHFGAFDGAELIGCARVFSTGPGIVRVGRVAVRAQARRLGVGRKLVEAMMAWCVARGGRAVVLDAQCSVQGFYESLGFIAEGEVFLDAGIPHVRMRQQLGP